MSNAVKPRKLWSLEFPEKQVPTPDSHGFPNPVIYRDRLILATFRPGSIHSIDRKTGEVRWTTELGLYGAPPHVFANKVFARNNKTLFAIDANSGKILWEFTPHDEKGEWIYAAPIRVGNSIFISDRRGFCYLLKMATGEIVWRTKITDGANVNAAALYVGNQIVTTTNEAKVVSLDAATGVVNWAESIHFNTTSRVVKFRKSAIVLTSPYISAVDLKTGNSKCLLRLDAWFGRTVFAEKDALVGSASWNSPDWKISRCFIFRFDEKGCSKFIEIDDRTMNFFTFLPSIKMFLLVSSFGFEFFDQSLKKVGQVRMRRTYFGAVPCADKKAIFATTMDGELIAYQIPSLRKVRKTKKRRGIRGRTNK